uniref:hypothetical protein n=1 Tax=Thaumasiovibrio occultus TaxID=1891184 RepID=UPI00192D087F
SYVMNDNKKPLGLVLISVYGTFNGLFSLFAGGILILASSIPEIPAWITFLSLLTIIWGALLLTSVYGIWTLQSWGLNLTFWLYVVSIPLSVLSIFPIYPDSEMSIGNTALQLFGIAIAVLVISYTKKSQIKLLFQPTEQYA